MAALTATGTSGVGAKSPTLNTLTASDTFVYAPGTGQQFLIRNPTAGAITPNLLGSAAVSTVVPGGGTVNYAAGYTMPSIAINGYSIIDDLDTIRDFLAGGTVTVTGGSGAHAFVMNPA